MDAQIITPIISGVCSIISAFGAIILKDKLDQKKEEREWNRKLFEKTLEAKIPPPSPPLPAQEKEMNRALRSSPSIMHFVIFFTYLVVLIGVCRNPRQIQALIHLKVFIFICALVASTISLRIVQLVID